MIYFIQSGEKGPIKIGFARDPEKRLRHLQGANPCELALLKAVHGDVGGEKRLHAQFAHLRIRGEWFEPGDDLLDYITAVVSVGFTVIESSCWLGNRLISKTYGEGKNMDDPPGVMTETTDGELSVVAAARLAGASYWCIRRLIRSGTVKASKVGGRWAVDHASLEGWLGEATRE